jgi:hypothetical protein
VHPDGPLFDLGVRFSESAVELIEDRPHLGETPNRIRAIDEKDADERPGDGDRGVCWEGLQRTAEKRPRQESAVLEMLRFCKDPQYLDDPSDEGLDRQVEHHNTHRVHDGYGISEGTDAKAECYGSV